jgi:hypothetical protein
MLKYNSYTWVAQLGNLLVLFGDVVIITFVCAVKILSLENTYFIVFVLCLFSEAISTLDCNVNW